MNWPDTHPLLFFGLFYLLCCLAIILAAHSDHPEGD